MNVGMLWFDNDARTPLTARVERAADYYRRKYGQMPTVCLVHPSMLTEQRAEAAEACAGTLVLRASRSILPGHLWIGVEDKH